MKKMVKPSTLLKMLGAFFSVIFIVLGSLLIFLSKDQIFGIVSPYKEILGIVFIFLGVYKFAKDVGP